MTHDPNQKLAEEADLAEDDGARGPDARHVGRADVAAARLAHVNTRKITENVAGRHGAEKVSEDD